MNDAVALVEVATIARGYVALDVIAKRARVGIRFAKAVTPGKFIILFFGDVGSTEESLEAARECIGDQLVDELFLARVSPGLLPALADTAAPAPGDAVGIFECKTVASAVLAADAALKCAEVVVGRMHLAIGIGGKGYFTLAGPLGDVDAALLAAKSAVRPGDIVGVELIAKPHAEVRGHLLG